MSIPASVKLLNFLYFLTNYQTVCVDIKVMKSCYFVVTVVAANFITLFLRYSTTPISTDGPKWTYHPLHWDIARGYLSNTLHHAASPHGDLQSRTTWHMIQLCAHRDGSAESACTTSAIIVRTYMHMKNCFADKSTTHNHVIFCFHFFKLNSFKRVDEGWSYYSSPFSL